MTDDLFSRHRIHWSEEQFAVFRKSSVLVAGVGGLGATVAQLLVRLGLGKLYLVDNGIVDLPDLNRQSLYSREDIDVPKVLAAKKRLQAISDQTDIVVQQRRIDNSFAVPASVGVVADCLDNYVARFSLYRQITEAQWYVHGGVSHDYGQVISLHKKKSAPLSELFQNCTDSEKTIPVVPDIVFAISSLMVREITNTLTGKPALLNKFAILDYNDLSLDIVPVG